MEFHSFMFFLLYHWMFQKFRKFLLEKNFQTNLSGIGNKEIIRPAFSSCSGDGLKSQCALKGIITLSFSEGT